MLSKRFSLSTAFALVLAISSPAIAEDRDEVEETAEHEQLLFEVTTDGTIDPEEGVQERPGPGTIEEEEDQAEVQGEVMGGEEGDVNEGNWDPRYGSGGNTD